MKDNYQSKIESLELLIQQKSYVKALEFVKEELSPVGNNHELLNYLGQIYYSKGDFVQAIRHYANAIRINPDSSTYNLNLGKVYLTRYKYDKAESCFLKVLDIDKGNVEAASSIQKVLEARQRLNQKRNHIVITGTGRAGTTFLVKLFTRLGLDTGWNPTKIPHTDKNSRAGLEQNILGDKKCSYIVKSPQICDQIDQIIDNGNIILDHAIIPMRDMESAALSRIKVFNDAGKKKYIAGGLWEAAAPENQEEILRKKLIRLLLGLSKIQTPVTLLNYPRLTKDPTYLYNKISPIFTNITQEDFKEAFQEIVDLKLVHQMTKNDI